MNEITTIELMSLLKQAIENNIDQETINKLAQEVVKRVYNPVGATETYEEALYDYGYRRMTKRMVR